MGGYKILTLMKGLNSVTILRKITDTNLDLININAYTKISEYDQEIPRSHTADQPMAG